MPLTPMKGWSAGSYTLAGLTAACQRTQNLYPEVDESGLEPQVSYLRGCPGLSVPLLTLPTAPLRGLLAGGTPLNPLDGSAGRMFAVAGSVLYEVFANGTFSVIGDVGDDASHSPVTLIPNGNQLGIVSAGKFWCSNGGIPVVSNFPGSSYTDITIGWGGTCDAFLRFLTRTTGPPFNGGMQGLTITVNGSNYLVANVVDGDHLVLGSSILPLLGAAYNVAGSSMLASSAKNPFIQADVSSSLNFAANPPFGLVSTTVLSVDTFGNATLSASPAIPGSIAGIADQVFGPVLASSGTFLSSFFIIATPNSKTMQASASLNGMAFAPLDHAMKEAYPDNIGAIIADHQQLLVLGESHSEVWQPASDPSAFPFQPNETLTMNLGIGAPQSLCSMLEGPVWIGAGLRGKPIAYFARGFNPVRISTHAIEQVWARFTNSADAVGFSYELDGHEFWQVTFPSADQTWVYDFTASEQMRRPTWHERNSWDGGAFHRHRASCHCYVFGKHWVGDFATGAIYELSTSIYTDNGQMITCIRTMPHLNVGRLRQFFTKLQMDLETGGGTALTLLVEWSDDGGTTWVGGGSAFTVVTSTTKKLDRALFWQLGSSDDRVFRITITGNCRKTLLNAFLDFIQGT